MLNILIGGFLTKLSREDWLNKGNQVQNDLTDDVIEKAITEWPKGIQKLSGQKKHKYT